MYALHRKGSYQRIAFVRLVGMMLIVYANRKHTPHINGVDIDSVGTGILGKLVQYCCYTEKTSGEWGMIVKLSKGHSQYDVRIGLKPDFHNKSDFLVKKYFTQIFGPIQALLSDTESCIHTLKMNLQRKLIANVNR